MTKNKLVRSFDEWILFGHIICAPYGLRNRKRGQTLATLRRTLAPNLWLGAPVG